VTALLAAIARFLLGVVEVIDQHLDDLSYRWGWR